MVGVAYSQTLAGSNGTTPYTWKVSVGTLPAGLTLSTAGKLSGTPTTAGTSSFTVQLTDAAGGTATHAYSLTVNPNSAPTITSAALANPNPATVSQSVTFTVGGSDADGDTLSYAWTFGDGATGSGSTATHAYAAAGSYTATATVSDTYSNKVSSSVTVSVTAPTAPVAPALAAPDTTTAAPDTSTTTDTSATPAPASVTPAQAPLTVNKFQASVGFQGHDTCSVSGTIPGVSAFNPAGQTVAINISGAAASFTLNAKGQGKSSSGSVALKASKSGAVSYQAKLSGDLAGAWSLVPSSTKSSSNLNMSVTIDLAGTEYSTTISVTCASSSRGAKLKK
jgi:hypothetical protein